MNKLPCESAVWKTLPLIRKELACCMVQEFGLNQKEAADILKISPAAISQYKCNKRANNNIKDIKNLKEIKSSAEKIIKYGDDVFEKEICKLCRLINKIDPCPIK